MIAQNLTRENRENSLKQIKKTNKLKFIHKREKFDEFVTTLPGLFIQFMEFYILLCIFCFCSSDFVVCLIIVLIIAIGQFSRENQKFGMLKKIYRF